jgi:RNA polymerase sigma-70 factor (ECF subfamily)
MARDVRRIFDELLVLHARAGDREALERLAAYWRPRHFAHARRVLWREEDAADAVQEAWIHIVRSVGRLKDPARFGAWSYAIVTRRCQDRMRVSAREPVGSSEIDAADPKAADHDAVEDMRRGMAQLPPDQRAAFALYYREAFSINEIAVALLIPAGTVKSRLFHARRALRQFFNEGNDHEQN